MIASSIIDKLIERIDKEFYVADEAGTNLPHSIYIDGDYFILDERVDRDTDERYVFITSSFDRRLTVEVGGESDPDNAWGDFVGYRYYPES